MHAAVRLLYRHFSGNTAKKDRREHCKPPQWRCWLGLFFDNVLQIRVTADFRVTFRVSVRVEIRARLRVALLLGLFHGE